MDVYTSEAVDERFGRMNQTLKNVERRLDTRVDNAARYALEHQRRITRLENRQEPAFFMSGGVQYAEGGALDDAAEVFVQALGAGNISRLKGELRKTNAQGNYLVSSSALTSLRRALKMPAR